MDIFDVLTLLGGLCLFLFGMNIMGKALEACAGGKLSLVLSKLTSNRFAGFLTGLGVTAVIQSSSATTVMVVGFVNSGLMSLKQAIGVIMGANVGTTVTAWILSLTGIEGSNLFMQLLKPSSFTPVLAVIGIALYMFGKGGRKKDAGMVMLGFATLMYGMEIMSGAVAGLKDVPQFRNILLMFSNPILGVCAGVVLTAVIQSSSAAVGILQALSSTGQITFGSAIPILMGMDIGTCVTAMLSSIGTNRNARRAAVVHLLFNVIGTLVWLCVFYLVDFFVDFAFVAYTIDEFWIAVVNSVFKLLCTLLLLPMSGLLEKLACIIVRDTPSGDKTIELDERLLATPAVAIERCHTVTVTMAETSVAAMKNSMALLNGYDGKLAQLVREQENDADHYEDTIGTYLVKLSGHSLNDSDSNESAKLLRMIGDFERISDHAVNILESAEEMKDKNIVFSGDARTELEVITGAVSEVLDLARAAFVDNDLKAAAMVEPLEQVVDTLKEQLRARHILRLQKGECTIEAGFVWSDLLTSLERVADHCSNIAGCVVETAHSSLDLHEYIREVKSDSTSFINMYNEFAQKYALVQE
ncbi:MAG: Na/Pi cotransporter family protein [Clostridiales bacterium]|nr:Na/Pi cotransporter family protein [Clostridiales bacterium]